MKLILFPAAWLMAAVPCFESTMGRAAEVPSTNDFETVSALFAQHCVDCHAAQEPEGKLVLETYETLMKGGDSGPALVPGKSSDSLLVKMIEGRIEKDGKNRVMPPGKRKKLEPHEIASIKGWIDMGALPPTETAKARKELVLPKVVPTVPPRRSIQAVAFSGGWVAVARYGEVELMSAETRSVVRTLRGHRGTVNALAFSRDGKFLAAAAGEPALFGEVRLWDVNGESVRTFEGHADALYAVAISPDGKLLATGSYDQKIKLWDIASGKELQSLSAHNGAIFDLAFRPDGKILASASGDRTVKLWNVATGKRVETLSQPLKEQHALAWSPDGKRLAAAGVDNRIRVWEVSETAAETTNPLLLSRFAHEGAILNVVYSSDGKAILSSAEDRTVKLWDALQVTEKKSFEQQPDVTPGLAFLADAKTFVVGRLDGTVEFYSAETGKRLPPAAPELKAVHPRGLQRGASSTIQLRGKHLTSVTNIIFSDARLRADLPTDKADGEVKLLINAAAELPPGAYDVAVAGTGGTSAKAKLFVDDLPQAFEVESNAAHTVQAPASFWGTIEKPGDVDGVVFSARGGQTMVLDLAVKTVGSKLANAVITLLDAEGATLETASGFDGNDRFIAYRMPADGQYSVRIADQMLGASADHFYRLSIGTLPFVTGVFPLSVQTNTETEVEVIGVNLPPAARARVKSEKAGETAAPVDSAIYRTRRTFNVVVADDPQVVEREPNDTPAQAGSLSVPAAVNARIQASGDADLFRFEARTGQQWILETDAARRGSPIDTRLEVLHPDGKPAVRLLLQAIRNTAINFRSVDSINAGMRLDNYEEMELNEYLYMNGDVMRLFRMPQGPDSDMIMYMSAGKRRSYFDTTAVAHALDEQGFIVEPQPLGTKLSANGLPVFTLNFENDDDAERKMGSDSRVYFTAPTNGSYLVRVTDTRGHGGEALAYRLVVREARPGFRVTVAGANPTVGPGSGQSFTVNAERFDGFEGEIRVDVSGLPAGFQASTPLVVEAGHVEAKGCLWAAVDAARPEGTNASGTRVTATAIVNGKTVTSEVNNLGTIKLGEAPKAYVSLEPYREAATSHYEPGVNATAPLELTIAPGQTIPAWLKIKRNGHTDLVTFFAENLPHGVIVADIGLNGVLIPKGESERQIFFNAARWVEEQDRPFYMIEQQAGKQTSRPVLLKVRKAAGGQASR